MKRKSTAILLAALMLLSLVPAAGCKLINKITDNSSKPTEKPDEVIDVD